MSKQSLHSISEVLLKLVKKSGRLLKQQINEERHIEFKSEIDIVTEMDKAVETIFIQGIERSFPDHEIVSEEMTGSAIPTKPVGKGFRWIIDPLDGTTNYAHRFPHFAVSAGIEMDGKVVLGAVYNPMLNELFFARQGKGAWLNDKPIQPSQTPKMKQSLLATGFPYDLHKSQNNNFDHFYNMSQTSQAIRRAGAAALDLCDVACGRFDGFWELKLKPWDVAAGALIIEESGARITDFNGKKMNLYNGSFLASNGRIHREMVKILKDNRNE